MNFEKTDAASYRQEGDVVGYCRRRLWANACRSLKGSAGPPDTHSSVPPNPNPPPPLPLLSRSVGLFARSLIGRSRAREPVSGDHVSIR